MLIEREQHKRRGFWPFAFLWLPVGAVVTTAVRFWADPEGWTPMLAGLSGPLWIAACAVLLSLPAWVVWSWLTRWCVRGR